MRTQSRKARILDSAVEVLSVAALTDWSLDRVAEEVPCSKGLVVYHYGNRAGLLDAVGRRVSDDHQATILSALRGEGTGALDALWGALVRQIHDGRARARLALGSSPSVSERQAVSRSRQWQQSVATAMESVLCLPSGALPPILLDTFIAGIEQRLLGGEDPVLLREAYDRFFLLLISAPSLEDG